MGQRNTVQREAIDSVFDEVKRPLRIVEILREARKKVPSLDQATVYRNLNQMVARGELCKINHPDVGTLFEKAGIDHHHVFWCRVCNRTLWAPGCALNSRRAAPEGYLVEGHDVFLKGVCADCTLHQRSI